MFKDRFDAGRRLALRLSSYSGHPDAVVLAVPRGGVAVGRALADALHLDLDVILTKKIGHPANSEYAIGSVSLTGEKINEEVVSRDQVPRSYIEHEATRIRKVLWRSYGMYRGVEQPISLKGKTAIIADDGAATGLTLAAAIDVIRRESPKEVVLAIPVAPPQTLAMLRALADDVVCLTSPEDFVAIGQSYEDFGVVEDEEVILLLRAAAAVRH